MAAAAAAITTALLCPICDRSLYDSAETSASTSAASAASSADEPQAVPACGHLFHGRCLFLFSPAPCPVCDWELDGDDRALVGYRLTSRFFLQQGDDYGNYLNEPNNNAAAGRSRTVGKSDNKDGEHRRQEEAAAVDDEWEDEDDWDEEPGPHDHLDDDVVVRVRHRKQATGGGGGQAASARPTRPRAPRLAQADAQPLWFDNRKFGFIVVDGNGALFGIVQGRRRDVLHSFTVDFPNKHGRGGQSALRFDRLRLEKRRNYVRKVADMAADLFLTNDTVNVTGLILAGSAGLKNEVGQSALLDERLREKILKTVDVASGGQDGFRQAVELAADILGNTAGVGDRQERLLRRYFDEIAKDAGGRCVYGATETMRALLAGVVETLFCSATVDCQRYRLQNPLNGNETIAFLSAAAAKDRANFVDAKSGARLSVIDSMPLRQWLANNCATLGAAFEVVNEQTPMGARLKDFGGIGALLRYRLGLDALALND